MKRLATLLLLLPIITLLVSFGNFQSIVLSLSPVEYQNWYGKNKENFVQSQVVDVYKYDLMLIPTDLKLLNYTNNNKLSQAEVKEFLKIHENSIEFSLKIEIPENGTIEFLKYPGSNGKTYDERLKYYAFELQKNIQLKTSNGKTYSCQDYVFERSFDIQPNATMTFSFDRPKDKKNFQVLINDNGFKEVKLVFSFESKKINKSPKLKYSTIWNK